MSKNTNEQKVMKIREANVDYKDCIRLIIGDYFPTTYEVNSQSILDKEDFKRKISFSIISNNAGYHTYLDAPDHSDYVKSFSAENYIQKIIPEEYKSLLDLRCTRHDFTLEEFNEDISQIYKLGKGYRGFSTSLHFSGEIVENPNNALPDDPGNVYKIGEKFARIVSFGITHNLIISKEMFGEIYSFLRNERHSPGIFNQKYDNSYSVGRFKKNLTLEIAPAEIPLGEFSESQLSSEKFKRASIFAYLQNFRLNLEMEDNTIGFVPEIDTKTTDSIHEKVISVKEKLVSFQSYQVTLFYPVIFCLFLLLGLTTYSIWF